MDREPKNRAASIKQRLLNLAREEARVYEVVLVRYALERLLYRLCTKIHGGIYIEPPASLFAVDPFRGEGSSSASIPKRSPGREILATYQGIVAASDEVKWGPEGRVGKSRLVA